MIKGRSIGFRLTVWYAAILTAGLGLFGSLLWLSLRSRLIDEVDRDLQGRASRFEQYFRTQSRRSPVAEIIDELEEFCQALPPSSSIEVRGSKGFVFLYPPGRHATAADSRTLTRQFDSGGEVFQLEVGAPIANVQHTLDLLRLLLFSLIPPVIVIACLGLFGLAAFTAQRRQKEIGIRKVVGASVSNIATMLSAEFLKLVLVC